MGRGDGEVKKIPQRAVYERVRAADEGVVMTPKFKAVKEGGANAGI